MCARIRMTFAGMWGLENDDEKTKKIIQVSFSMYFKPNAIFHSIAEHYENVC